MKSCLKSLNKALDLFTQKNRPNIYLKSHSFSLFEILFKKIQCLLMLQDHESIMNQYSELFKLSKGLFKPNKSELGAKLYYEIIKSNSDLKNKTSEPTKKNNNESKLRVNFDEMNDVGIVTYYRNKPFTGLAYSFQNGTLLEEIEMVEGLKHGICKLYSTKGEVIYSTHYLNDEMENPDDKEEYYNAVLKRVMEEKNN